MRVAATGVNSDIAPCGIAFLDAYSSSKDHPKNEHWDLSINNRMQLSSAARLNRIRVISNKLFIFDMGSDATVPWSLAVESATIAVMVCRMDKRISDYGICYELLQRGVKMHTLLPTSVHDLAMPSTRPIPVRLPGYEFTYDDYDAY
ncbi:hypothetical protein GALMADRAFT_81908, partial [Galerina marginata CBS 339.88]